MSGDFWISLIQLVAKVLLIPLYLVVPWVWWPLKKNQNWAMVERLVNHRKS